MATTLTRPTAAPPAEPSAAAQRAHALGLPSTDQPATGCSAPSPGGRAMRVLVTESDPRAADEAVHVLESSGHQVVRCTGRDEAAFPCRGVAGGGCPLDEGVDAALAVRAEPHPEPTASEAGITCALRQHLPLVVLGGGEGPDPFEPWRAGTATLDDLPARVEEAVHAELPRHTARVTAELCRHLPVVGSGARASVHRDGRRAVVTLRLPTEVDDATAEALAVRAAGAVREIDHWTPVVDVTIERGARP
jgi:hypothetical protein